ncbi:MAG: Rv1733c family protein [Streptosporangiaceae bacterium]
MATPTTTWMKLARRLGRDGNPLRRRSDVLEAWLVPAAIVVFLVVCPLVAGLTGLWLRADNAAAQRAQQSWHSVSAVLLRAAPGPEFTDHGANAWTVWEPARWTVDRQRHAASIPVAAGSTVGSTQTVWLDGRGRVQVPPLTPARLGETVDAAMLISAAGLAIVVGILTLLSRWILDRRRIARWEAEWLALGPIWSHQP